MSRSNNHYKSEPGRGLSIVPGGDFEKALKIFKRKVMTDGLIKEVRKRQAFEKPSEVKQRKRKEAKARWRKQQELMKKYD